jgi:hypothetical protein
MSSKTKPAIDFRSTIEGWPKNPQVSNFSDWCLPKRFGIKSSWVAFDMTWTDAD